MSHDPDVAYMRGRLAEVRTERDRLRTAIAEVLDRRIAQEEEAGRRSSAAVYRIVRDMLPDLSRKGLRTIAAKLSITVE